MKSYINLLNAVLENGDHSEDRTGTGTIRMTGGIFRHNMKDGFPAVTTKKLNFRAVVAELIWFMRGSTNVEVLRELTHGEGSDKWVIWDPNYNKQAVDMGYTDGYLGPVYGKQWRDWNGIDQLQQAIDMIKGAPNSRRILISAWNVEDLPMCALPPCHFAFQFLVKGDYLDLVWYQRSADTFLGVPFNIASYGLLLSIVAQMTGKKPGHLVGLFGDVHVYKDHVEQVETQLSRPVRDLPTLKIDKDIQDLSFLYDGDVVDCFQLVDYNPHGPLKGKMSA
ncbi:MAG: thymidylate synthase [Cetobacterium sp.]|uniref:thymidylate synthase n=1 Tax=Cetobacterium sp. TaxID=2071632 RepID=UPI003EE5C24D